MAPSPPAALSVLLALSLLVWAARSQPDGCSVDPSSVLPPAFNSSGLTCRPVWNNFILRYSQTEDHVLNFVLSTVYTLGWVGIGFSKDGMMTGSSAMVGWIGKTGVHHIKQFYLGGRSRSEVVVNEGKLSFTSVPPVVVVYKANIYMAFQLNFSASVARQNILLAFGTSIPVNNRLKEHNDKISISFDFSTGFLAPGSSIRRRFSLDRRSTPAAIKRRVRSIEDGGAAVIEDRGADATTASNIGVQSIEDRRSCLKIFGSEGTSSSSSYPYHLKRTHGILNIFGWGVLLPIGAIFARYFRRSDPLWYYIHAVVQFIGFIIGLAGVVAGVALYDKLHADVSAHRGLGIFILVLGILQVLAIFLRPNKDSKIRRYWNWYHHWVGRLALCLAVVNIFLGIRVGGAGTSWKVGYGINLGILLIATVALEVILWTRWSQKTAAPLRY